MVDFFVAVLVLLEVAFLTTGFAPLAGEGAVVADGARGPAAGRAGTVGPTAELGEGAARRLTTDRQATAATSDRRRVKGAWIAIEVPDTS